MSTRTEELYVRMKRESDMDQFRELFPKLLKNDLYRNFEGLTDNVISKNGCYEIWIQEEPLFGDPFNMGYSIESFMKKFAETIPDAEFFAKFSLEFDNDSQNIRLYFDFKNRTLKETRIEAEFYLDQVVCNECQKPLGTTEYPKCEEEEIVCSECGNVLLSGDDADIGELVQTLESGKWKTMSASGIMADEFDESFEEEDE